LIHDSAPEKSPPVKLEPQITFPHINIFVAIDGIKIEIVFGPSTCLVQYLDEPTSNAMFHEMLKVRKKKQEQEVLIRDVMRSKQQGG